jgi:hypothetical protein
MHTLLARPTVLNQQHSKVVCRISFQFFVHENTPHKVVVSQQNTLLKAVCAIRNLKAFSNSNYETFCVGTHDNPFRKRIQYLAEIVVAILWPEAFEWKMC